MDIYLRQVLFYQIHQMHLLWWVIEFTDVLCLYEGIWWTGWELRIYSEFSTSS